MTFDGSIFEVVCLMLDQYLRVLKERILQPITRQLISLIHPTQATLIGFAFGLISAYFASQGLKFLSLLFWILNRVFDGIDGILARLTNQQSDFGGYIDILCDFTVYSLIPIGIAVSYPSTFGFVCLSLMLG